ncbi:hypothetical protein PENTCL1PPCAC_12937, partial [Pristionchus entomophagus]
QSGNRDVTTGPENESRAAKLSSLAAIDCDNKPSLLSLPNEILLMILHLLPTPDRLRTRVNRRLCKIESEGNFNEANMQICTPNFMDDYCER